MELLPKKIKVDDITINITKPNFFISGDENIKVGDIIAYAIKPQTNSTPVGNGILAITEMHQPTLQRGILIEIIDNDCIYVLEENGKATILNKYYFSNIKKIHDKNSDLALLFYNMIFSEMCQRETMENTLYKLNLLFKISKKFDKKHKKTYDILNEE